MTTGNSAIWRGTTVTAHKAIEPAGAGTDKIEFDIDAVVPDTTGHISNTQFEIVNGVAENTRPFADVNEVQYTGVANVTVTITGHVQNPISSLAEVKMKVWILDPQTTIDFNKGRFGMRLNDFPMFNVTPLDITSGNPRGYGISDIKWIRNEIKNRLDFVMTLKLAGDLKSNTGANYDWS